MKIRVVDVSQSVSSDLDVKSRCDVRDLDTAVFTCLLAASNTLSRAIPAGFSDLERDQLVHFVNGLRSSHISIRKLLSGGHDASSVDALVIARLQLESLYSFCYLLKAPENVRLYLKNGWKKRYIRFLIGRAEMCHLPGASEFYLQQGPEYLEKLRIASFVTPEEKAWLEFDELGVGSPTPAEARIKKFPTPMGVIEDFDRNSRQPLLKRLYPEYQYLCSFAHGAAESSFLRAVTDPRSPIRHFLEPWKTFDIAQREVAENAILYSALSCLLSATEVFAACPSDVELSAKLAKAWNFLLSVHLLAGTVWDLRVKGVLGVV